METYRKASDRRFSDKQILHMYTLFHTAAPSGEMGLSAFEKFVEKLTTTSVVGEKSKRIDTVIQSKKLFRGYDLNGDGSVTFHEFLSSQAAILHGGPKLLQVVFSILDRDRDNCLVRQDFLCAVIGTEAPDDIGVDATNIIETEVEGLWQFVSGKAVGAVSLSYTQFCGAVSICPELLDELLLLV
ncbi:Neurocalcin-like protein [Diplonema papillatum]|nr:Neurocalcin-like protein [Diplonema papillatum]